METRMKERTQAERLFTLLRRKSMTYMDLMLTGISTCPHKRLSEGAHLLRDSERLMRSKDAKGRVTFRVVKA
jgi:hypothetical protein